jgi:hypothetical protein
LNDQLCGKGKQYWNKENGNIFFWRWVCI